MKHKSNLFWTGFMFVLFLVPLHLLAATIQTENKEGEIKATEQWVKDMLGKNLGSFIAVGTGVIKNGEQIPLPVYQDGKTAKREEARYLVSPNEMATTMTYLSAVPGVFFIQSSVDKEGFVHVSLKQKLAHNNEEVDVVASLKDPDSKESEEYNKRHHISAVGADGTLTASAASGYSGSKSSILDGIREKTVLNYFVIAIRSQAESEKNKGKN